MKILIVEDDPLVGPAMAAVLRHAGHTVAGPVRDLTTAMRSAETEPLDLALVDYVLAGGRNGLCVVRRLEAEHGVPSLLVTGYDHHPREVRDLALGLLSKPFSPTALIDAVEAAGILLSGGAPPLTPTALTLFRTAR